MTLRQPKIIFSIFEGTFVFFLAFTCCTLPPFFRIFLVFTVSIWQWHLVHYLVEFHFDYFTFITFFNLL
jgi:hypothetical protein